MGIDVYYNANKDDVTHNAFKDGYAKIPCADLEFASDMYQKYLEADRAFTNLHTMCKKLIKPSNFILYNGIKYGNTLENCKKLTKLYHSIKRELPKFHEVEEPIKSIYEYTQKRMDNKTKQITTNKKYQQMQCLRMYAI